MTEMRNIEVDLSRFRLRVLVISICVLVAFLLLAARLVYLQVVRHEDLSEQAENNRTAIVPVVPNRGLILDRNGIVLASNYSAYTLEITPSRIDQTLDKTIEALGQVIDIQARDKRRFKKLLDESKSFESLPIRTRLTDEEVARFAAQRYRFPGVDIKARLFRNYPWGELASHVIGYIGRINQAEKERIDEGDDEANYRGTEYIGKLGVEQSYEQQLHQAMPASNRPPRSAPPIRPSCEAAVFAQCRSQGPDRERPNRPAHSPCPSILFKRKSTL